MESDNEWDPSIDMCDPETCPQCNPVVKAQVEHANEVKKEIDSNPGPQLLAEILQAAPVGHEVVCHAKKWYFWAYICDGYRLSKNKEIKVSFVKVKKRFGVLYDEHGNMWIYHNGTTNFTPAEFPKMCPYQFLEKGPDWQKGPDVDAKNHIKILLEDSIFEDFVHQGGGLIIANDQLQAHHAQVVSKK